MDTYRDDSGALRDRVEALQRELEETQRSLEEARALAGTHKRAARKLESELMQTRPGSPRRAALVAATFIGIGLGVLVEAGLARERLRNQERASDHQLADCRDELSSCRAHK